MPALADAFVTVRPDTEGFRTELNADLKRSLLGSGVTIPVKPDSDLAKARFTALAGQLSGIVSKLTTIKVNVDNKAGQIKLDSMLLRAARLQDRLGNMRMDLKDALGFQLALDRMALSAEKLNDELNKTGPGFFKRTSTWAGVGQLALGVIGRGGGGAAAGGAAAGGGGGATGIAAAFANPWAAVGIVAAALAALPFAAQTAAAAITIGLGGALTGLGIYGAAGAKRVKADFAGLSAQTSLELRQVVQPFVGALKQISVMGQAVLPTIMLGLVPVMKVLAPAFQAVADALLKSFAQPAVIQAIQSVGKAFAGILKALAPAIPGIIKNIATGINDIAGAIERNPKAFVVIIDFLGHLAGWTLQAIGYLAEFANYIEAHFLPAIGRVGTFFNTQFDEWRHGWASIWDDIYSNTVGALIRLNTAMINGISSTLSKVVGFFARLPGQIVAAIRGVPSALFTIGKDAITMLWDGAKSQVGGVIGFLQGFAHGVVNVFKTIWGWFSPSTVMFQAGRDLMLGLQHGIKSHSQQAMLTGAAVGGNVRDWIVKALQVTHAPLSWLPALERLVSLESGGNPHAYNPTSVGGQHAEGLFQTLPSTFYAYSLGGSIWNPIADAVAGIRYLEARYGSPYNIPGLFSGRYQGYDSGGWLPVGLSLALNKTGRPERVLGPGEAGGITVNVYAAPGAFAGQSAQQTGHALAQALLPHTRAGGRLYPTGVKPK